MKEAGRMKVKFFVGDPSTNTYLDTVIDDWLKANEKPGDWVKFIQQSMTYSEKEGITLIVSIWYAD